MKRTTKILSAIIALSAFLPVANVNAAGTITSVSAKNNNGTIVIEGTATTDMLAASFEIYEEDDTAKVAGPESTSVSSDGKFTYTFSGFDKSKTYIVYAADYDGGSRKSTKTTIEESKKDDTEKSDKAGTANTGVAPSGPTNSDKVIKNFSLGASIIVTSALFYGTYLIAKRKSTKDK